MNKSNEMIKALQGVLHHNDGVKQAYKLPESLINQVRDALFQEYRLIGTYRHNAAIGAMDGFSIDWVAISPKSAMDEVRQSYYDLGYEHILFTRIQVSISDTTFETIPMLQVLELE